MRLLGTSPYLNVTLSRKERKLTPYALTQGKITGDYILTVTPGNNPNNTLHPDQNNSFELFINMLEEVASDHPDKREIRRSADQASIIFPNDPTAIEKFITDLRDFELDKYCECNNIKTMAETMFSQGISLPLSELILLTNALIQNTNIALSKTMTLDKKEKEFRPQARL